MSTQQQDTYRVVHVTLIDHAANPAIAFTDDDTLTRDELDTLIASVNELHGFNLPRELTVYDDDGSLWWGDEMVAEVA